MNKSFKRDVTVLYKMLDNIDSARDAIKSFNISLDSRSANALFRNKFAFDLCAFYMAQFGEKVKLLTDSSKKELSSVADLNILRYFRNIIDHDYERVDKAILQGYIKIIVSDKFRNKIIERIKYCQINKR